MGGCFEHLSYPFQTQSRKRTSFVGNVFVFQTGDSGLNQQHIKKFLVVSTLISLAAPVNSN